MQRFLLVLIIILFLFVFYLLNRYVVSRMEIALYDFKLLKLFKIIYWTLAFSFFIGQLLERFEPFFITKLVSGVGGIWLAWFMYVILSLVVIDLIRMLNFYFHFIPKGFFDKKFLAIGVFILTVTVVIYGYFNARNPIIKRVTVKIEKSLAKPLKVALVSDLHIGAIVSTRKIKKMVQMLNTEKPDIVLIAGDLVDHNPKFAIKNQVGNEFDKMKAPLGIYAITGNHEYIGDAEMSINYFSKHNIQYIRDNIITINNQIQLVGREDKHIGFAKGKKRKDLGEILINAKPNIPLILMDHQPIEYDEAIRNKVDLMVSGHTHKGQMWPLNYITQALFENHYGLYQKSKTWFYTSNGFGTWGSPVRVGNRPELVIITIKGTESN